MAEIDASISIDLEPSLADNTMNSETESINSMTSTTDTLTSNPIGVVRHNKRSWVWNWGKEVAGKYWRCNLCHGTPKQYKHTATSHIIDHLKNVHHKLSGTIQSNQSTLFLNRQLNRDIMIRLIIDWVVQDQQPFTAIESTNF